MCFVFHRLKAKKISLTFTELELVENRSFTGSIETDHKDAHFLLAELSLLLKVTRDDVRMVIIVKEDLFFVFWKSRRRNLTR